MSFRRRSGNTITERGLRVLAVHEMKLCAFTNLQEVDAGSGDIFAQFAPAGCGHRLLRGNRPPGEAQMGSDALGTDWALTHSFSTARGAG